MNEDIKALLDALRACQIERDNYKRSTDYWRDIAENMAAELSTYKDMFKNKPNGSEA